MRPASSTKSWSRNGTRASRPQAIVMLSTRLTGSSTSMIVVSLRSAASTAVSAPGRANWSRDELRRQRRRRVSHSGCSRPDSADERPVEEDLRRRPRPRPSRGTPSQRRVPVVAAEDLVGALAGLHDLDLLRDVLG